MHELTCTYVICSLPSTKRREMNLKANHYNSVETRRNLHRSIENANLLLYMFKINIYIYITHKRGRRDKLIPTVRPDCFLHIDSVPHLHLRTTESQK